MRVSELLTLMGHLSVGCDNITPSERAIFLQYLNLAHLELYQETANFNQDLLIKETFNGTNPDGTTVTLLRKPYLVSSVYDAARKKILQRFSVVDAVGMGFGLPPTIGTPTRTPFGYCIQKNTLSFIPAPTGRIFVVVWYTPQPPALTEEMDEGDIPYPVAYHPVLVDGALYYLFQEEGGFKSVSKQTEAMRRWETGKSTLLSWLYSSSGQSLSTFSNA